MDDIIKKNFEQTIEYRPWGKFVILADDQDHKVKRITVLAGQRLSLQSHQKRMEHWVVVAGRANVRVDKDSFILSPGDSIDIARGAVHRVENNEVENLVFIEVQLGEYFGEDDIERIEDDYGRLY